jgi:sugar lactone lactonase YvrE
MRASTIFLVATIATLPSLAVSIASAQDVSSAFALSSAVRLKFDHAGNLFVSQRALNRISKIAHDTSTPVLFASGLLDPVGLGIDSQDNLYIANYQGTNVNKVTPAGTRTVFATGLSFADCVAVDTQDNVYVGEITTQNVYMITPAGVKTLYGNANLEPASTGPNGSSRLTAIAFDPSGNLWCGTYGNAASPGPYALSVIPAGGGTGARMLKVPQAIFDFALSSDGTFFYTAGYQENQIGQLSFGGTMVDYAGTGVAGLVNGPLASAKFNWPSGIAIAKCQSFGNLFIADWNNNVVREIALCPTAATTSTWGRVKADYR